MQIRLTVVDPLGPHAVGDRAVSCDVLVTAPAGTALAAVASGLAAALPGGEGQGSGQVVLYAGAQRLDAQRSTLGEPPLIDGAVLCLGAPGDPDPHTEPAEVPAQLHVVAGPDAGGVHLLHGGQIRLGRSADADVALDDPDVSRMHCAVTVAADGRVSVADLGSTNGTVLDGTRVGDRPVRFAPGALLRIGESALRLVPVPRGTQTRVATTPDGEGHVRLSGAQSSASPAAGRGAGTDAGDEGAHARVADGTQGHARAGSGADGPTRATSGTGDLTHAARSAAGAAGPPGETDRRPRTARTADGPVPAADGRDGSRRGTGADTSRTDTSRTDATRSDGAGSGSGDRDRPAGRTHHAYGAAGTGTGATPADPPQVPGQGGAPRIESHGTGPVTGPSRPVPAGGDTHGGASGAGTFRTGGFAAGGTEAAAFGAAAGPGSGTGRKGTPVRGTDVPQGVRRRHGLGAWARRLTGGRGGAQEASGPAAHPYDDEGAGPAWTPPAGTPHAPEAWPDPAALLLTALGPGPRLWERGPGHPEALTVRLGTTDRVAPGVDVPLPAVPVTAGLREVGALGLAGPRARLAGLARAVLAQLAALHSADVLEIVLISADRSRPLAERTAEWSWLGWLPQLRPGHGQDCRLLLAYDREQATARAQEVLRRLEDHLSDTRAGTRPPVPVGTVPARPTPPSQDARQAGRPVTAAGTARQPSWARPDDGSDPVGGFAGSYTVVVVDGDPGGADLRETLARLALEGPRAGIHVVCLAETAAASPTSPVTETYEAACAVSPVFRECGAVALLSGDVATALRLLRIARASSPPGAPAAPTGPVGHGTLGTADAVSLAWAERFARALAPLRTDGALGERHARVSAPLPQAARLLDELGLARATPASLMARWADAADDPEALGGRAHAVLGAGPRGPVTVDLTAEGPHLLIEGPPGSGRTELLRALVASLASAERPDRLGIVLMDGRDSVGAGGGHGEGLRICTDVPHVTTHLTANDPVLMREFAQSLSAELKRRAELLGRSDFAAWHTGREVSGRMVAQRTAAGGGAPGPAAISDTGDVESPPSSTLRLRPGAARRRAGAAPPLPRLVVIVDDLDALVTPPLGSPGRPAAGSVMRALEAVAREGERLGVHLVAATAPGGRTAQTEPALRATLRVTLDPPVPGPDEPAPGRGRLARADGRAVVFQGGRVTGRIPRTATLRPTVVPLEWHRMGDPPTRRPVRELGNGPTDLALLASALERAAREVAAAEVPSLL
ncbi:FHA domain-containing protein [Streptomyces lancefieldiae]|uniref:FHA domain-containing protein n=1 Tax=Streptomyces lancefieldiae TaxID=3075520 RepID=A0ABU3ASA8_9ACTN|nr:FHA domain-containing protein [Streptomyces sp. DSM 40712]MDT0613077.1 FHA domain-containing protein [Streptomyces sp. DSM 40712]